METKNLTRFAEIKNRLSEIEAEKKKLNQELEELEAYLIQQMAEEGIDNMTVNTYDSEGFPQKNTLYVHRQLFASPVHDRQATCEALKEAGLDEYVKPNFNSNQLSAYVREFAKNGDSPEDIIKKLPSRLQEEVKVAEKHQLRARKAS